MDESRPRSAKNRFGGAWGWELEDGSYLNISEAIRGEGPGQGFAMVPWILDHYERALRLQPGETWLLKRLLKHAWEYDSVVYVSQRKIAIEANITRPTLRRYFRRLEELGYIHRVSNGTRTDRRKRYTVSGLLAALALCVAADPSSKWSRARGSSLPLDFIRSRKHMTAGETTRGFDIDLGAIRKLAERNGRGEECFPKDWEQRQSLRAAMANGTAMVGKL